jgi:hypothetical protein
LMPDYTGKDISAEYDEVALSHVGSGKIP